jgi:hypothetical protein
MGILADAAMAAGGEVIGVMPRALVDREVGHTGTPRRCSRGWPARSRRG